MTVVSILIKVMLVCFFLLATIVPGVWTESAVSESDSAAAVDGTAVSASSASSCTLQPDGTCLPEGEEEEGGPTFPTRSSNEIPILPPEVDNKIATGYGEPQEVAGKHARDTRQRIQEMHQYMYTVVYAENYTHKEVASECENKHQSCAFWASIGECDKNPSYMKISCAPACMTCEHLSFGYRCPLLDQDMLLAQNVWKSGDLNAMFERIVNAPEYNTTVLLKPTPEGAEDPDLDPTIAPGIQPSLRPWVVIIDDFLSPEECKRLIELGAQRGYEVSRDVGPMQFDGTYKGVTSSGRTSTNAWCTDECYNDTITQQVLDRHVQLTGIPDANAEYLQLLRYEVAQFYEVHHDYIGHHVNRAQGVRILTLFLYLNYVEEGGGTRFPRLNMTVMPKQGRALLWPSVYNDRPDVKDPSTDHEAMPVLAGIKYGANAWFHQRDFKTPHKMNCI